jgi:hypothetical protein
MNYINKLKKLGFKRCEPSLVCEYSPYYDKVNGYYIESAVKLYEETKTGSNGSQKVNKKLSFGNISTGFDTSGKCRFQTYRMDICQEIRLYITILGDKYWSFIQNDLISDSTYTWDKNVVDKRNVDIILDYKTIGPYFWIEIQNEIDKDVLRMIRLNNLFA